MGTISMSNADARREQQSPLENERAARWSLGWLECLGSACAFGAPQCLAQHQIRLPAILWRGGPLPRAFRNLRHLERLLARACRRRRTNVSRRDATRQSTRQDRHPWFRNPCGSKTRSATVSSREPLAESASERPAADAPAVDVTEMESRLRPDDFRRAVMKWAANRSGNFES